MRIQKSPAEFDFCLHSGANRASYVQNPLIKARILERMANFGRIARIPVASFD